MTEKDFETTIRSSLECFFPMQHVVYKHWANEHTGKGHPDLYGHIRGVSFWWEVKSGSRPSKEQWEKIKHLGKTGAFAGFLCYFKANDSAKYLDHTMMGDAYTTRDAPMWITLPWTTIGTGPRARRILNLRVLVSYCPQIMEIK